MPSQISSSLVPTSGPGWNAQNAALNAPTLVPTSRSGTSPARASTSITPTWNAPRFAPPLNTTARRRARVGSSQDQARLVPLPFLRSATATAARGSSSAIGASSAGAAPSRGGQALSCGDRRHFGRWRNLGSGPPAANRSTGRGLPPPRARSLRFRQADAPHHGHDPSRAHDADPGGPARGGVGAGAGDVLAEADCQTRRAIDPDQPRRRDLRRRGRQGADPRDPPVRRVAGGDGADDAHDHRLGGRPMTMEFRQLGAGVPLLAPAAVRGA